MTETVDTPIGRAPSGRLVYDNAPTVVCVTVSLLTRSPALIVVRRGRNPGAGLLGLPGGFQMHGENWQDAGAREFREETGYRLTSDLELTSMETDDLGHNVLIADCNHTPALIPEKPDPAEVQEVIVLQSPREMADWAFPIHYYAVVNWFHSWENTN